MKRRIVQVWALLMLFVATASAQFPLVLEAEKADEVVGGPRARSNESWKEGEFYVNDMHRGSALVYHNVMIEKAGVYQFDVVYMTGDDNRPLSVQANDYDKVIARCRALTASWDRPPTKISTVYIHLDKGPNTITIATMKDWGPNLDKFIIRELDNRAEVATFSYDLTQDAELKTEIKKGIITTTVDCGHPVLLTGYLLASGGKKPQDVNHWILEGSTNKRDWKRIEPALVEGNEQRSLFHIKKEGGGTTVFSGVRYYRLTLQGKKKDEVAGFQLFGVPYSDADGKAFNRDLMARSNVYADIQAIPAGKEENSYRNLFDRNPFTNYYDEEAETFHVIAEVDGVKTLDYYTLTSSHKSKDRDLRSWQIEGYDGYSWEVIDEVNDYVFPCRLATMKFPVNTKKGYQAFRLKMLETAGSVNFQLAQWQLFGSDAKLTKKRQERWAKKESRISTPWYDQVNPKQVHQEYPRPQMVRDSYVNLNGIWDFKESIGMGKYRADQQFDRQVLVPFPIESALSGLMLDDHADRPYKSYLYQRSFTVPGSMKGQRVLLHFGAVDWRCEVYVNGQPVGTHEGGYDAFYFDITHALKPRGQQELQVQFMDPSDIGGQPCGKQRIDFGGMWYTPSSGIWQTVWMEGVNEDMYIRDFQATPDIDNNRVLFNVRAQDATDKSRVVIRIYDGDMLVAEQQGGVNTDIPVLIANPKLWSPDSPFLYNVEIDLKRQQRTVDQVKSYVGMRKTSMGFVNGQPCLMLNNRPLFQHGPLDQGYWPESLHAAPCDEALVWDIEQTKAFGFNMTRKHIKTEPARFYYHCDRLGLLVWQDMPCVLDGRLMGDADWVKRNFLRETRRVMDGLKNFPSIVQWIAFNEGFGQFAQDSLHTKAAVDLIRSIDDSRVINSASGWVNYDIGEVLDRHSYPVPNMHPAVKNRAAVCGEYGGITWVVDNHVWKDSDMVYVTVQNNEELKNMFRSFLEELQKLKRQGLCGAVYTQITDLEGEVNGLITYDRKVVKMDETQRSEIKWLMNELINHP